MNDNSSTTTARDDVHEGRSLVAAFDSREAAHDAARALHQENFGKTWIGVTRAADGGDSEMGSTGTASSGTSTGTMVESDDDGGDFLAKIGRFFSGDSGEKTLYDELVRHGVAESEARRIDGSLQANSAILTVDGSNHPELAAQIIEENGGHVLAGESFGTSAYDEDVNSAAGTVGGAAVAASDRTGRGLGDDGGGTARGSDLLGYRDPDRYARGSEIDEQRRVQLREERLNIDKQSVSGGEATIGKEVVEQREDIDVPTVREELFVERRPVSESTSSADAGQIGQNETIRIPLMREQVVVTKRPVVTGEVLVGKRQVTETQHVSDTTRREELRVNDATRTGTTADTDLGTDVTDNRAGS